MLICTLAFKLRKSHVYVLWLLVFSTLSILIFSSWVRISVLRIASQEMARKYAMKYKKTANSSFNLMC